MIRAVFSLSFIIVGVIGCSSVELQRGKELASAGLAYSEATSTLIDVTIDSMIDANSEEQVYSKLPPELLNNPEYPQHYPDKLIKKLEDLDDALLLNVKKLIVLRASLATFAAYFKALQSLADSPQSENTATAVSNLSDRLNSLNSTALEKKYIAISDEQKTALSGLSKLVADQIHGAKVGSALKRDAKIIGEAILLQKRILGMAEKIIRGNLISKNNRFYIVKVQRPYEKQTIDMGWVENRRVYLKAKARGDASEALKEAREASKRMEKTWEKILSGVYETAEMRKQIEELEAIVAAMLALKQAEKPKNNNY